MFMSRFSLFRSSKANICFRSSVSFLNEMKSMGLYIDFSLFCSDMTLDDEPGCIIISRDRGLALKKRSLLLIFVPV